MARPRPYIVCFRDGKRKKFKKITPLRPWSERFLRSLAARIIRDTGDRVYVVPKKKLMGPGKKLRVYERRSR